MGKYNVGEVWWVHFPYRDEDKEKRRPAIIIDDEIIVRQVLHGRIAI